MFPLSFLRSAARKGAQRLCRKAGLTPKANCKPGKHLSWDHPSLARVRDWISLQIAEHRFHPQLIANFDQTWSLNVVPRRKVLQPSVGCFLEPKHKKALRHRLERAIGLPHSQGEEDQAPSRMTVVTGGSAANYGVDGWRTPHTLTTLSWIDGSLGRGFITVRADHLGAASREKLNQDGSVCVESIAF